MKPIKVFSIMVVICSFFFLSQSAIAHINPTIQWTNTISSSDSYYNHCYSSADVGDGDVNAAGYSNKESCSGMSRGETYVENISRITFDWSYYVERDANITVTVATYEGDLFNLLHM
ncbi:hypothetical protein AB4Z22_38515, partial [Paenibacillus sp. TAF58]